MSAASERQNGKSSSCGTTWFTRPHVSAVAASRKLPVALITRQRVAGLGAVQGDRGDTIGDFDEYDVTHWWSPRSLRSGGAGREWAPADGATRRSVLRRRWW